MSRGPSAHNPKKQVSQPKTKSLRRPLDRPTPPSKVVSTKSKSSPKNIIASSMKTSGSMKPKGSETSRSPLKSKNSINVKAKNGSIKNQTTKGLGSTIMAIEKKPIISDALSSSQNNHNIITHDQEPHNHSVVPLGSNDTLHDEVKFEYGGQIRVCENSDFVGLVRDKDMLGFEISCDDNVSFAESVDNKHTDDRDEHINQQNQADDTYDIINDHLDYPIVDQEHQEVLENEQVAQDVEVGSVDENREAKDEDIEEIKLDDVEVEPEYQEHEETELESEEIKQEEPEHEETDTEEAEHEETRPDELEIKEDDVEVPKNEDTTLETVVKNQEVVMHGKKDSTTYNIVIEETVSKLREQRKNRVLALAGAFETVISLESDVSPKDFSPKNLSPKLSPKNI
ncbi:unnamed protein product [Lactuca saligna]|uniref:Calmodulin-binding domain-containing protein n=1 Tax=Lactuca saligna TaxID=75948 RepID=A0AA36DY78_LACSI|nr:unnamed protein product [Lactuca saligna]